MTAQEKIRKHISLDTEKTVETTPKFNEIADGELKLDRLITKGNSINEVSASLCKFYGFITEDTYRDLEVISLLENTYKSLNELLENSKKFHSVFSSRRKLSNDDIRTLKLLETSVYNTTEDKLLKLEQELNSITKYISRKNKYLD